MKFKLTVSNKDFVKKPTTPKEAALEKLSLTLNGELTIEQISKIVLQRSFVTAEMSGISSKDWKSQNVFALDFDSGFTPEEFVERSNDNEIPLPNIIYTTSSDSPEKRKFRVLYCVEDFSVLSLHDDFEYCDWIRKGLMSLFPVCDPACKNADRMFYPGKEVIFFNDKPIEETWFRSICEGAYVSKDFKFQSKMAKKAEKTQAYNNNIGKAENLPFLRNFPWSTACKDIKILDKFFNGQYHLNYQELFGLATNLQFIEGGLKNMKKRMQYINSIGGGFETYNTTGFGERFCYKYFNVLTVVKYGYLPMMLSNFSSFKEDHQYHNILELGKFNGIKKGIIDIISKPNRISLIDAEAKMQLEFSKSFNYFNSADKLFYGRKIFIFKTATGLGKTRLLEAIDNALIASPTHHLKDALNERRNLINKGALTTPEGLNFSDDRINDYIKACQDCDLYDLITDILNRIKTCKRYTISLNNEIIPIIDEDISLALLYSNQNTQCRNTTNTVLTTHARAIFDNLFQHDTVIFDEDPLKSLIQIKDCATDWSVFDNTQWSNIMKPIEDFYRNLPINEVHKNQSIPKIMDDIDFKIFCMRNKRGDIIQLLNSDYLFIESKCGIKEKDDRTLKFCKEMRLPNKDIIIMSATIPVAIYKNLYGSEIEVIELEDIVPIGQTIQYTNRSFSKNSITGSKPYSIEVFDKLFSIIGDSPIITHIPAKKVLKNQPSYHGNSMNYHFGNCSGADDLGGQNIAVIGTPNIPLYVYYFYATLGGITLNIVENPLADRLVEFNGMKFRFFTFEDTNLQKIQFDLIASELVQAVGRARTLRNSCIVYLFSTLPLKISTQFIFDNISNKI